MNKGNMNLEMTLDVREAEMLLSLLANNSHQSKEVDSIWRKYSAEFYKYYFVTEEKVAN